MTSNPTPPALAPTEQDSKPGDRLPTNQAQALSPLPDNPEISDEASGAGWGAPRYGLSVAGVRRTPFGPIPFRTSPDKSDMSDGVMSLSRSVPRPIHQRWRHLLGEQHLWLRPDKSGMLGWVGM